MRRELYGEIEQLEAEVNDNLETLFPALADNLPGATLAGARDHNNLTQVQLAEITNIPRRHISDMENGRRPIGKETARKLAMALHTDYRVFL